MSDERVERGASEEASGTPLTETEVQASERPPSVGDADPAASGREEDASGASTDGVDAQIE
jgi:hypothetical protein